MKILLIYPVPSIASPQKSPPLSILYVGEAMKQQGYDVRYYDERYDECPDLDWPDVVGVSSMTGYQLKGAIFWLKMAHSLGKQTILGGIHATMQPEQCLQEEYIDQVVAGPGEWAMHEAILSGNRLTWGTLNGKHVSPVTADTLIHFQRSARTNDTILLSSRGCRFRCGFCYTQQFWERHWESVDLERWKGDVLYLKYNAGLTHLEHGDDWIGKWDRAYKILTFLKDAGVSYRPSFRADQITLEMAKELRSLGIKHVSIGMESGSERILKLVQKDIARADQERAAHNLFYAGIWPLYYWIVGFPTETPEEMYQTLDQMDEIAKIHQGKLTQDVYAYTALPGTSLYDLVNPATLPDSIEGWSDYSLNHTTNQLASNIYHIGGFHFHQAKGDKTDRNFPGLARLAIKPFETLMNLRWYLRVFGGFGLERWCIEKLLAWRSRDQLRHPKQS